MFNSILFTNNIKNFAQNIYRNYAFKSDLKIKWVRPEKISSVLPEKSGDCSSLPPIDMKEYIRGFEKSKELVVADDITKKIFQLENNPRKHVTKLFKDMFNKDVQRHFLDNGSMESRIADMTATIRRLQQSLAEHPRNLVMKVYLKEKIDQRKKFLKYLRKWDYKRFEWILEKLDLVYKPPPNEFHWITRKESLRKLTNQHCENIKTERLNLYREMLESKQIDFLENKIKNLEFIRKEQEECEVPITVTQQEIENCKEQLINLKMKRDNVANNEEGANLN